MYLYVMDVDGRNVSRVADSVTQPSWLPSGKGLVGVRRVADRVYSVVAVDIDGRNMKTLLQSDDKYSVAYYPVWLGD